MSPEEARRLKTSRFFANYDAARVSIAAEGFNSVSKVSAPTLFWRTTGPHVGYLQWASVHLDVDNEAVPNAMHPYRDIAAEGTRCRVDYALHLKGKN